jgi:hypothetical protein
MSNKFRGLFEKLLPWWLQSGDGGAVSYSLGLMLDLFAERMLLSLKARFPDYAPSDALTQLSRDRKIVRGRNESDAAFAVRLKLWLDSHRIRGNPFALMKQLRAYCQTDLLIRTVDRRGNWFEIAADGTQTVYRAVGNFDWDGTAATSWSRFWVIIYPNGGTVPWAPSGVLGATNPTLWGTGKVLGSAGRTIGTTATSSDVAAVRTICKQWKPANAICEWIIIAYDETFFAPAESGPVGYFGNWGREVAGNYVPIRSWTAAYWKGPT